MLPARKSACNAAILSIPKWAYQHYQVFIKRSYNPLEQAFPAFRITVFCVISITHLGANGGAAKLPRLRYLRGNTGNIDIASH